MSAVVLAAHHGGQEYDAPPVAIHTFVPTPGAQQVPGILPSQPFASGAHWIQGTAALTPRNKFNVIKMNHTKAFVLPSVSLSSVTAKALFVQPIATIVAVARLLRRSVKRTGSPTLRSQLCRPRANSWTSMVDRMSSTMIVT